MRGIGFHLCTQHNEPNLFLMSVTTSYLFIHNTTAPTFTLVCEWNSLVINNWRNGMWATLYGCDFTVWQQNILLKSFLGGVVKRGLPVVVSRWRTGASVQQGIDKNLHLGLVKFNVWLPALWMMEMWCVFTCTLNEGNLTCDYLHLEWEFRSLPLIYVCNCLYNFFSLCMLMPLYLCDYLSKCFCMCVYLNLYSISREQERRK